MPIILILTVSGILAMFGGIFKYRKALLALGLLAIAGIVVVACNLWGVDADYFGMMRLDMFSLSFSMVLAIFTGIILIFYNIYYKDDKNLEDVYALVTFGLAGAVLLTSYTHLVMLFLGIETLSLSLYVLAGVRKHLLESNEAALKYFLMGAFSTCIMLLGIALVYGATGSFTIDGIADAIARGGTQGALLTSGMLLLLISLLFKIAAAPFHLWTPDVYQGSDTIVTTYMATVAKIAFMAAFMRLFGTAFSALHGYYVNIINIVAVLTMFIGNITAIYQKDFKRMLAFSSIAHAGYMLLALSGLNALSNGSILMYGIAYGAASIISFVTIIIISKYNDDKTTDSVNGLIKANPLMGVALVVSMLSLAGIPITAGFFAKFYIFNSAVQSGYLWVVIFGILNSAISLYYYFRPIISACFKEGKLPAFKLNTLSAVMLVLLILVIMIVGIMPSLFMPGI